MEKVNFLKSFCQKYKFRLHLRYQSTNDLPSKCIQIAHMDTLRSNQVRKTVKNVDNAKAKNDRELIGAKLVNTFEIVST